MPKEKRPYRVGDKKADQLIDQLVASYAKPGREDFLREILTTAIKVGMEQLDEGNLKLINTALKELRYAFKVLTPYRQVRKVVMFGSARTTPASPEYKMAEAFAKEVVRRGFLVMTGASTGIMEAGNKGAGRGKSFGVSIRLPLEQEINPYVERGPQLINFKYFFTRKLIFIKESDATAIFPGGFGTHDETFEILTLVQTGKTAPRPILLVEPPSTTYWDGWRAFIERHLLKIGYISPEDMRIFKIVKGVREAADEIERFFRVYHSIRFVREKVVLRLRRPVSERVIRRLDKEFSDILHGPVVSSGPLPEEREDNDLLGLPRLVMCFNQMNFGRLRLLIDTLNREG